MSDAHEHDETINYDTQWVAIEACAIYTAYGVMWQGPYGFLSLRDHLGRPVHCRCVVHDTPSVRDTIVIEDRISGHTILVDWNPDTAVVIH